ncbi:MAG: M3 family metallopeptidase, partial [Candidatus Krumholzibacteria bacterium]|nr:M3 family metallopeptidase [Candidatus Krumholzibacteria bacterium]
MAVAKKKKADFRKINWDLSELYSGKDDPKIEKDFRTYERAAERFAGEYRGKVGKLDLAGMVGLLKKYEKIQMSVWGLMIYAHLEFATKSNDPEWGAFMQMVQERFTRASSQLAFLQVEWTRVPAARAKKIASDPQVARYRHFLEHSMSFRKHTLSEKEEILSSKYEQIGQSAWSRYYGTVLSDIEYRFRSKAITESELTALFSDPDRSKRRDASTARIKALKTQAKPLTFAFNMILAGEMISDEARNYEHWVQGRNKSNEIPDEVVDALVSSMLDRKDILQRYYRLKKKLLGVPSIMSYDTFAPLPTEKAGRIKYEDAVEMVQEVFQETRKSFGKIADQMFDQIHVDVPPYKGKRGGAFCMPNMGGLPYVLLNWTGKMRDVATLAHEFGHAVHMELSRKRGPLSDVQSLVMAEVASVFMETILYQKLLGQTKSARERLSLLRQVIEDGFATTFRQLQFNRFEDLVHNYRREKGELATGKVSELFLDAQTQFFGKSMTPHKGS